LEAADRIRRNSHFGRWWTRLVWLGRRTKDTHRGAGDSGQQIAEMRMKQHAPKSQWLGAVAAFAAMAIPCAVGFAQDMGSAPPDASGMPRNIVPAQAIPPEAKPEMPIDTPSPAQVVLSPVASPVQIGELSTIEGPIAGILDNSNGGLGNAEWQGSNRATITTMLQSAPATTPSATERLLMRKLLLTAAPPPPGMANGSFNQIRLSKLLDGGDVGDAAQLAIRIQEPNNLDVLRTQTDALLYGGKDNEACSDITTHRLDSAEPFWVELRAYCYAATNDTGPLDLTRAVIMERGIADPAFVTLLDGWVSGKPVVPDIIRFPDSIHVAMLARLKLPMTREIATEIGLPGSLIAAASMTTPPEVRIAAAEKAFRAGVLPPAILEQVLDLSTFAPQELEAAPALARVEPFMKGLARLRAALKTTHAAQSSAELVHTALEIGEREGMLRQVAELFAAPAAEIIPNPDWTGWSDLMARGLLLAGRAEAAQRWLDILDPNAPDSAEEVQQLSLAFALAAPNPRRNAEAKLVLAKLSQSVSQADATAMSSGPDAMGMAADPMGMIDAGKPVAKPSPEQISRSVLDLGIFDAVAADLIPSDSKSAVEPLMKENSAGRRPAPVLMQRIDKAALSDSRGEVALSVATALGDRGPGDLAPDVVVRLVRALQTASIRDAAHLLAQEALLLRPAAGAGHP
jgi:hypothetical protein